jgi:hypothetical protein
MANLTFDTAYNRAIAQRVVEEGANHSWQPDKFIYGGTPKRSHILSGNTPYDRESSFDTVGGRRMAMPMMEMVRPIGGRKGKTVKTMDALSSIIPKKVRKSLVSKAVEAVESTPVGGISYVNKASKWLELGKQLIPKKTRRALTDKSVEMIQGAGMSKTKQRGMLVSAAMKSQGMTLGQASRYVKEQQQK